MAKAFLIKLFNDLWEYGYDTCAKWNLGRHLYTDNGTPDSPHPRKQQPRQQQSQPRATREPPEVIDPSQGRVYGS